MSRWGNLRQNAIRGNANNLRTSAVRQSAIRQGQTGDATPEVAITSLPALLIVGDAATVSGTCAPAGATVTVTVDGEAWGVPTAAVAGVWSITATPTAAMVGDDVDVVATITGASDTQQTTVLAPAAHYSADVGVTTRDDGGTLYASAWADTAGGGYHLAQAVEASQPLYIDPGQNGLPVLRFDGIDDFMNDGGAFALAQPFYTFAAAKVLTGNTYFSVLVGCSNVFRQSLAMTSTTTLQARMGPPDASGNVGVFEGSARVLWSRMAEAATAVGDEDSNVSPLTTGAGVQSGVEIGARIGGSNPTKADVYEVFMFGDLTAAQRQLVIDYLVAKWGV